MGLLFSFLLGLAIGSFLNVCIYRTPRENFWSSARYFCPHCKAVIPFYYNIPVLSYLLLQGQTACCKKEISLQYLIVELLTGLTFALLFFKFTFLQYDSFGDLSLDFYELSLFLHGSFFLSVMIVCAVIDYNFMIIPDKISWPMIFLSPLAAWGHPHLSFQSSFFGIFLGGGLILLIAYFYHLIRGKDGIGLGDAKLLAVVGGWLGFEAIFPTLFLGSIGGSFVGVLFLLLTKQRSLQIKLPFGPFLVLGAAVYLFLPLEWLEWFLF